MAETSNWFSVELSGMADKKSVVARFLAKAFSAVGAVEQVRDYLGSTPPPALGKERVHETFASLYEMPLQLAGSSAVPLEAQRNMYYDATVGDGVLFYDRQVIQE